MNIKQLEQAVKCCISGQCTGCPRQAKEYPEKRVDCKCLLYDHILAALREKQERENPKPCDYCDSNAHEYVYVSEAMEPRIFFDVSGPNIRFFDEQFEGGFCDMFKIRFCPMCGRKLDHEPKEANNE
jgi:hypothetical protein